jgi:hypothetical protein
VITTIFGCSIKNLEKRVSCKPRRFPDRLYVRFPSISNCGAPISHRYRNLVTKVQDVMPCPWTDVILVSEGGLRSKNRNDVHLDIIFEHNNYLIMLLFFIEYNRYRKSLIAKYNFCATVSSLSNVRIINNNLETQAI